MKRLSLALVAAGLSAGAFAALPAATDPTVVNVPQLPGGFVVGVSGFYLQPTNSNGDLDFAAVSTLSGTVFSANLKNVDPGYDWGWGVNVGYIFPNTGNDVNLSYFQLDTSDTAHQTTDLSVVNPDTSDVFDFTNANHSAKAEYDLDQVDLTVGQYIDVGCRLVLHPFAGLRWAQLDRTLTTGTSASSSVSTTVGTTTTNTFTSGAKNESDFEGIGPIVGLDASYYVGMGFGVVGHFDSALLIGNVDDKLTTAALLTSAAAGTTATLINTASVFSASNTRRVVPVMDAKLGLDYTYVFNNSSNSDLTLEAGWMASNYFNAVDKLGVAGRTTSDFGLQGPYVNLTFHA